MSDSSLSKITSEELLSVSRDLLNRSERGIPPFQLAHDLAEDLERAFGFSVEGIWVQRAGRWESLGLEATASDLPGSPTEISDSFQYDSARSWWPIPGKRLDSLGLISVEGPEDACRLVYDELLPVLRVYLREIHEESDVAEHELIEFDKDLAPDFERARRSRNLDEVLRVLIETVARLFDCNNCRLFWLEDQDTLRLRVESKPSSEIGSVISVGEDPIIQSVIEQQKSIIINNLPDHDDNRRSSGDIRSFLSVPFHDQQRVRGTLNLSSEDEGVFTREDLQQLSTVAENFAFIYQSTRDLANLTEYVEKILSNLPVGVVNLEHDRDSVRLNRKARSILKLDGETQTVDQFKENLKELGAKELLELIKSENESNETGHREFQLEQSEAFPRTIDSVSSSVREVEGEGNRMVIVLNDVTEQRLLSEQVNRAERLSALGELSAGLAHEIKNPLTSIQGFVQLLPKRSDDEEFIVKTAEVIERESRRLNALVENLVSFGRPQIGNRCSFDLGALVDDVELLVRKKMEKQDVRFSRKIPEEFQVYGDEQKLKQVLINLILNGLDAVEENGTIVIRARRDENDFVFIAVEDDGIGMTEEQQNQVINPFYTTKKEGTGLGLAISHRIVEEHGGELSFESAMGKGTVVKVAIPPEKIQNQWPENKEKNCKDSDDTGEASE